MVRPDILFIHGAFTRGARWRSWLRYFTAAGYRCYAPSLPAHDPPDPAALSRLTFADYVAFFADIHARCDAPPIIIGHSMGGLVAQHLAARRECAALVLLSSTPPWPTRGTRYALPYLLSYVLPVITGRPIRATARAARDLVLHDLTPAEQRELAPIFAYESGKAYRTLVFGRGRLRADAIDCPVLCVNGGDDRLLAQSVGGKLARFYRADHMVFAAHGHSLVAESLIRTVAVPVRTWLARHGLDHGGARAALAGALPFAETRSYINRDQSLTTAA
jgi:pimeloyl-ACP methyl ester carboxylesterase